MRRIFNRSLALFMGLALVITVAGCGRDNLERTVFTVEGMHCDGCSSAITDALTGTDGVERASADHETGIAEAVYRPRRVGTDELKTEIERLGYTVTGITTETVEG